jgi:CheY-like chemotaxis protein
MGGLILYIDDEFQLPAGFVEALDAEGFHLVHVDDPEAASRLIRVDEPELVLLEVMLSSCDGLSLMEEIRSFGGWPAQVPIVVLTKGERSPELYGRALELEVKEFLTKPALKAQLLESVREFAGQASEPEPTLSGDLADLPIPEILHCLRQDAATGVLWATHGKTQRAIQLRNGAPVAVGSSGGVEAPEDLLARCKHISSEQHKAVKRQLAAGMGGAGEILIGMGALSEEELGAALQRQAEELVFETFRWTSGSFGYYPEQSVEAESSLPIDCNPAELIVPGILHASPAKAVSDALRDRAALYVSRDDKPPYGFGAIALSSAERVFLENMNGDRTVDEVLDSGEFSERLLYALFVAGFLEFHRDPVIMLLEEVGAAPQAPRLEAPPKPAMRPAATPSFLEPSPEPVEPAAPFLEPSPLAPPPSPPAAPVAPIPPVPPVAPIPPIPPIAPVAPSGEATEAKRIEGVLIATCERIASQDDFGVLGVSEQTPDEQVLAAYEQLLETIRFDEVPADVAHLAERARKRIDVAFEHLQTADSRRAYAALCREEAKVREKKEMASRAYEAENWFRKGEGFLKAKKYGQAVEAFGMSAHLDPTAGEYAAHLGYSLFLSAPKDSLVLQEALEHIAKGIKVSPLRETSYLYLGRIFRANGAADRARKMFERAVRIKPDCHAAHQELRILNLREQKSRGFLNRLLKK